MSIVQTISYKYYQPFLWCWGEWEGVNEAFSGCSPFLNRGLSVLSQKKACKFFSIGTRALKYSAILIGYKNKKDPSSTHYKGVFCFHNRWNITWFLSSISTEIKFKTILFPFQNHTFDSHYFLLISIQDLGSHLVLSKIIRCTICFVVSWSLRWAITQ